MATTRSVSVELLGNYAVDTAGGVPRSGDNPATVGLDDGGFVTAIDDVDFGGITVEFSDAAGANITSGLYGGSDPSIARLASGAVALVYTTPGGQISLSRDTAENHLGSLTVGTGSNAEIATSGRLDPGYAVVWERSEGGIALAIAASDDAASLTQVVVSSSSLQIEHDPSVARLANGNYVVAWTQYGSAAFEATYYAVFNASGEVVTPATFAGSSEIPNGSGTAKIIHPSVAAYGNDFTISFEDIDETGEYNIAQYTRSDDGRNVAYRYYEPPAGSQERDPDTATVGALHVTAFTSNYVDGDDIRVQDLYLGISEPGTGTVLTDADNLVHIADDGSQASVSAIPAGDTGRFIVSYYDRFGGEVRQQLARVRETVTGDASNQTLEGKYDVAVSIDGGGGDDSLSDGDGDDTLLGNTGNDVLHSRDSEYGTYSGNDLFDGGDGVDTLDFGGFFGGITASLAVTGPQNTNAGTDTILRIENLTGSGFGGDRLTGTNGANVLDDGGPNRYSSSILKDTLIGGLGNDTYLVTDSIDVVSETSASGGTDLVKSRAASFVLPTNVENLTLLAEAGDARATGNGVVNVLTGNAGANILDGKAGADTMVGLAGSDLYYVDTAADRVTEAVGGGTADRVVASLSYVLAAGQEIETLATISASATTAINLTGNEKVQTLTGNAGVNLLDGKAGADTLIGYAGNDTFYVDNAGDRVIEAANGGTADRVLASVSYALAAGQGIETLVTTSASGTGTINLTGNDKAQTLYGNNGINLLDGKAGADILRGYAGKDGFAFTTALGSGNVDHIVDFSTTDDTIRLENAIFTALGTGALNSAAFKDLGVAGASVDADDRILYNHNTGVLSYDADGSGAARAAVQFAILDNHAGLTFQDFLVV